MDNIATDFLNDLRESEPGFQIALNTPCKIESGVLCVPYFDMDDDEIPDFTLPILLIDADGNASVINGPSEEWDDLLSQIP